jgi:hypothetical protein
MNKAQLLDAMSHLSDTSPIRIRGSTLSIIADTLTWDPKTETFVLSSSEIEDDLTLQRVRKPKLPEPEEKRVDRLREALDAARDQMFKWCDDHQLARPKVDYLEDRHPLMPPGDLGYYYRETQTVMVHITACPIPSDTDVVGWLRDYSPIGVMAHEFGHHVNQLLGWKKLMRRYYDVRCSTEKVVSSYGALQDTEDFAEAFRLFITNPGLLALTSSRRYMFLAQDLEFGTPDNLDWKSILASHPNLIEEVEGRYTASN